MNLLSSKQFESGKRLATSCALLVAFLLTVCIQSICLAQDRSVQDRHTQDNVQKVDGQKTGGKTSVTFAQKDVANPTSVRIDLDSKPFTTFHYNGGRKPFLFPVYGPGQVPMTRSYPMKKGVANESNDHPHHQSIWFTHGNVNKADFWISSELRKGTKAKIETTSIKLESPNIISTHRWVDGKGEVVCKEDRKMGFGKDSQGNRWIDFQMSLSSADDNVFFGDTKEGMMAIRTHSMLRLSADKKRGTTEVYGKAFNSEGVSGRKIWGKRAKWVCYQGKVNGKPVGIAFFDHNKNYRHPTWWHARQYGLVAANPFGIHDFERKAKGTGDFTLAKGKQITFRYRMVFFEGEVDQEKVEAWYQAYLKK